MLPMIVMLTMARFSQKMMGGLVHSTLCTGMYRYKTLNNIGTISNIHRKMPTCRCLIIVKAV